MSFFNLARSKGDKSVSEPAQTPVSATRAREVPLPVDIYEGADELLLLADLPGVEPDGLSVSFEAPELTTFFSRCRIGRCETALPAASAHNSRPGACAAAAG